MIDNKQATQKIYTLMREIRDTIQQLDPDAVDLYLSLAIHSDGTISFNNTYWELPEEKQINFNEDLDDHDD